MTQVSNKKQRLAFLLHGSLAAFGAYFCMYGFRKPFSVGSFHGLALFGVDYKITLVSLQVIGYAFSKIIGIKVISELAPSKRKYYFICLILIAEFSLLCFGLTPVPYNAFWMLVNGLPLGMIWGIVFSYLEGRRTTEILGIVLSTSFIVSSGIVKSVGLWVMHVGHVSDFWMPAVTGLLFLPPLLLFVFLLEKIPAPDAQDIALKTKRVPMNQKERVALFKQFALPLCFLILFYTLLTAFRDFRDNFARELWDSVGFHGDIAVYSSSEIAIALIVLPILGGMYFIKNNMHALLAYHLLLLMGVFLVGASTFLFQQGKMLPYTWMILTGLGLYICYVPFNALFFDRFVAAFKLRGNAGFLIYLADSFGYLGSIGVLFYKNFGAGHISWLFFFCQSAYVLAAVGAAALLFSFFYLKQTFDTMKKPINEN